MKKIYISLVFIVYLFLPTLAQNITQNIRGHIVDKESQAPLSFVTIAVYTENKLTGSVSTDDQGYFSIANIPVGRINIAASLVGYKKVMLPNILINASKEVLLNIEMENSGIMTEVVVSGTKKGETINEMATVSAHTFTVEETNRYAGSRGDPARMATNFAGVSGTDDSRNDIVIRGNSPFGILYRLEGVNIPNPTHFAVAGSTGGPVGMLNNKVLANSDFMTGAFPSEYGNSMAGVFDIRMKSGNDKTYEGTAQFGVLGAEAFLEGPLSKKKKSSFIFNYRYATLGLLVKMGIDIGTAAIPKYQDFQFKLNFPQRKGGTISFFGLGGLAKVNLVTSDDKTPERDIYSSRNQDEYFRTKMGVIGFNYLKPINDRTYAKLSIAASSQYLNNKFNRYFRHIDSSINEYVLDTLFDKSYYKFQESKVTVSYLTNTKISGTASLRYGLIADLLFFNYVDSNYNESSYQWVKRMNYRGVHYQFQPYIQTKFNLGSKVTVNAGLHGQWFTLNNSWSIEPRAGLKYQMRDNQSLSLGVGFHSQTQPYYIYFLQSKRPDGSYYKANKNLDFSRSFHVVASYDIFFKKDVRIKLEAYYQNLYNIPVDTFSSSYSLINEGGTFDRFFPSLLENRGKGRNYGIELTVEKFFTHHWFIMFSGSLFDSKYTGSDGIWRNTDFNNHYVMNLLGTKEFQWGKKRKNVIGIGGKITYGGGRNYSPYDLAASQYTEDPVIIDAKRNSLHFKDYFRMDVKLNYTLNTKKGMTHEIGIDLVNVTGNKNLLKLSYVGGANPVQKVYQLGFLPLFYYKFDFSIKGKN